MKTIAVHSDTFHADDALSIYFLRQTEEFKNANYVRTRDPAIIEKCDAVCDVGGIYDHEKRRYDHHQKGFNVTFEDSKIKLSSCGLVYLNFGKEINTNILRNNGKGIGQHTDLLWKTMYRLFVKEIDAIDNGVSQFRPDANVIFQINTHVSQRVAMLNSIGTFDEAIELIGKEYENRLLLFFDSDIPAIEVAEKAFKSRFDVDPSGQLVLCEEKCSILRHIKDLELIEKPEKQILYIISYREDGNWSIRGVSSVGFEVRKPLPFKGLRDDELSQACGIPGGVFVHKNAFMAIFKTQEQAIQFAKLALAQ